LVLSTAPQISADARIRQSTLFNTFLREAQSEVKLFCEQVSLDIWLLNNKSVSMDILSTDETEDVLEVCLVVSCNENVTFGKLLSVMLLFSFAGCMQERRLAEGPNLLLLALSRAVR